jgi:hypothetical protein
MCIERLGSPARAQKRLDEKTGRNSRVFRVELEDDRTVLFKFYRHDPGDNRDRLATEFRAIRFMWDNGLEVVPRAIAAEPKHYCGIYEFIDGTPPNQAEISSADVDALVDFLANLQPLRVKAPAAEVGIASEASFSLAAIIENIGARANRLHQSAVAALGKWFEESFDPLAADIAEWSDRQLAGQSVMKELDDDERTLSPSDFGFHNAIRRSRDGSLAFVDFEYFGWDDPAKTVADLLLHPGMALPEILKQRFAGRFLERFSFIPGLRDRARIVYPLYGLKWCLILLNDFLPDRETTATNDVRATQLEKAGALVDRIRREYRENPFV